MATGYVVHRDKFGSSTDVGANPTVNFKTYDGQEPPVVSPALAYSLEMKLLRKLKAAIADLERVELARMLRLRACWTLTDIQEYITDNLLFNLPENELTEMSAQVEAGDFRKVLLRLKYINRNMPKVNPAAVYGSKISKKYSERKPIQFAVFLPKEA